MKNDLLDSVTQELPHTLPLLESKVIRAGFRAVERDRHIAPHHFMILKLLKTAGPLPVSGIGGWHHIPKSHMTYLIDQLVKLNLVERRPDTKDRRVIKIALTRKGNKTLNECESILKASAKEQLSSLGHNDLRQLAQALSKVRQIVSKIE